MSYRDSYEKWLASPALSQAEKDEQIGRASCRERVLIQV